MTSITYRKRSPKAKNKDSLVFSDSHLSLRGVQTLLWCFKVLPPRRMRGRSGRVEAWHLLLHALSPQGYAHPMLFHDH